MALKMVWQCRKGGVDADHSGWITLSQQRINRSQPQQRVALRPPFAIASGAIQWDQSALNAVFEHLAGGESGHALGRDLDFFAGLGVQTLAGGALTGLEGAEAED